MRPADVAELRGDSSKAAEKLGWTPTITFDDLVQEMLGNDLKLEGVNPAKHLRKPPLRVGP
jgi:GDP-D-mannose dehydratase